MSSSLLPCLSYQSQSQYYRRTTSARCSGATGPGITQSKGRSGRSSGAADSLIQPATSPATKTAVAVSPSSFAPHVPKNAVIGAACAAALISVGLNIWRHLEETTLSRWERDVGTTVYWGEEGGKAPKRVIVLEEWPTSGSRAGDPARPRALRDLQPLPFADDDSDRPLRRGGREPAGPSRPPAAASAAPAAAPAAPAAAVRTASSDAADAASASEAAAEPAAPPLTLDAEGRAAAGGEVRWEDTLRWVGESAPPGSDAPATSSAAAAAEPAGRAAAEAATAAPEAGAAAGVEDFRARLRRRRVELAAEMEAEPAVAEEEGDVGPVGELTSVETLWLQRARSILDTVRAEDDDGGITIGRKDEE